MSHFEEPKFDSYIYFITIFKRYYTEVSMNKIKNINISS